MEKLQVTQVVKLLFAFHILAAEQFLLGATKSRNGPTFFICFFVSLVAHVFEFCAIGRVVFCAKMTLYFVDQILLHFVDRISVKSVDHIF